MYGTANILQETPDPEANVSTKQVGVRFDDVAPNIRVKHDVFIDHTHWRFENKKVARTALLALNMRSPSLLKRPSEVRY